MKTTNKLSRQYEAIRSWCPVPDLFLDIGACHGESIRAFRCIWPDCRIISFEPRPHAWPKLEAVAEEYGNAEVRRYGLGAWDERLVITEYPKNPGGSSLLPSTDYHKKSRAEWISEYAEYEVTIQTLDSQKLGAFTALVIKIDVEGFADRVIAGGSFRVFTKAKAAIIESCVKKSRYIRGATFDQIKARMKLVGFKHVGNSRVVTVDGVDEWCDSVWLR